MSDHFAMVWSDLLGSSINDEEVHVRWCFLVMLLLSDKEGNFRSTVGFMSRMAVVPMDQAEEAFLVLSSPDPASSSREEEGRRIVPKGPNDWHIVNYERYRKRYLEEKKRDQARDRKRAQRDRDGQSVTERDGHVLGVTESDPVDVDVDVPVDVSKRGECEGEETTAGFWAVVQQRWIGLEIRPACTAMSDQRKSAVAARARQHGEEAVLDVVTKRARSNFLSNEFNGGRGAPFDWVMGPKNFVKVMDGNYDDEDREGKKPGDPSPTNGEWCYETYRRADLENHRTHSMWEAYIGEAADFPPKEAPKFLDWLDGLGA